MAEAILALLIALLLGVPSPYLADWGTDPDYAIAAWSEPCPAGSDPEQVCEGSLTIKDGRADWSGHGDEPTWGQPSPSPASVSSEAAAEPAHIASPDPCDELEAIGEDDPDEAEAYADEHSCGWP